VSEPSVRLYGTVRDEHSSTQVTRGMKRALDHHGQLAGLVPCDMRDEYASYPGATAPVSLNVGNPEALVQAHRLGHHLRHWLLYAPNGERLPDWFVGRLTQTSDVLPNGLVDGFLSPSAWGAGVLRKHFPAKPVVVAPHGVTPEVHCPSREGFGELRQARERGELRILHMTSTGSSRKGTPALVEAWQRMLTAGRLGPRATLFIVADPLHLSTVRWMTDGVAGIQVASGLTHAQEEVADRYRAAHLVCQPSRAEGFGLCPLEALACGTPVVATACTGHSEYLFYGRPGAVIVSHGTSAEMAEDYEGARAPSVTTEAIEEALCDAFERWPKLKEEAMDNAQKLGRLWAWEAQNARAIRALAGEGQP